MANLAIITARGGSKRILKKNIKEFCGKPIIAYSIEAALESGVFDEIMVSTDDIEIAEISQYYGAKVPFMRSERTSNDFATTNDVLKEVIDEYKKRNLEFEHICCIYPTAPFITGTKLKEAYEALCKKKVETVMPVVSFSFPPQRAMIINNEKLIYQYPEFKNTRSQDLEKIYHDAGQFYFFNAKTFCESGVIVGENVYPIIVSDLEVQDIDNIEDWLIAEMKYKLHSNQG